MRFNLRQPGAILLGVLAVIFGLLETLAADAHDDGSPNAQRDLVIKNIRVVDVVRGVVTPERTIVVRDGRILSVSERTDAKNVPADAEEIDADGMFAIPGLFDCHVHLGGSAGSNTDFREWFPVEWNRKLTAFLASGVTTVRSLCDHKQMILQTRSQIASGNLLGPDILCAGPAITAPGGHPTQLFKFVPGLVQAATRQIDKRDKVRPVIEELAEDKVDCIKAIYSESGGLPQLRGELLKEVIAIAHEHELPVTVHVDDYDGLQLAVEAGADSIEHAVQSKEPLPRDAAAVLAELKPFYCPTLAVYNGFGSLFEEKQRLADAWVRDRVSPVVVESLLAGRGWWHYQPKKSKPLAQFMQEFVAEHAAQRVRELREAGCTIVAGSDCGNPLTFHGPGLVRELVLLEQTGMSGAEALRAATIDAARSCGVEEDYGSIEPGKVANLVLLDADPLEEITNVRRVQWVVLHGRPLQVEELLALIKK